MCFGAGAVKVRTPAPVQLPPPPQLDVMAPGMLQSTPAPARPDVLTAKKRGKRALTIPQNTGQDGTQVTTQPGA